MQIKGYYRPGILTPRRFWLPLYRISKSYLLNQSTIPTFFNEFSKLFAHIGLIVENRNSRSKDAAQFMDLLREGKFLTTEREIVNKLQKKGCLNSETSVFLQYPDFDNIVRGFLVKLDPLHKFTEVLFKAAEEALRIEIYCSKDRPAPRYIPIY